MRNPMINHTILLAITAVVGVVLSDAVASDMDVLETDTVTESFEEHMGPWTARGSIACYEFGCPFLNWQTTRTTDEAHEGAFSLNMTSSGQWDDGTIWIQRPILLEPGKWEIDLQFYLHDTVNSPINAFPVVAYIGFDPPQEELDFEQIGATGQMGWNPYDYSHTLVVDEPTAAWVAAGYSITWETCRTFHIDSVTVSGVPTQLEQTPGDLTYDGEVNMNDLLLLLENWGPCPHDEYACWCMSDENDCMMESPETDCFGDITGSAATDVNDLLLLLSHWD